MRANDVWDNKKLAWWELNNGGHTWKLNEDGVSDRMAMSAGLHNGPVCSVCGYSFCEHCKDTVKECQKSKT